MPIIENNDKNKNAFLKRIGEFLNPFKEWCLKNFLITVFMYVLRRNIPYLISKEKYKQLKPLFRYKYVNFNSDNESSAFVLTDKDIEFYISIINKLPHYEKHFIKGILSFVYDDYFHDFPQDDTQDPELSYDGFDVGRYVVHKKLFCKDKYYKITKRHVDMQFGITLDNGKSINILPFNFMFYIPISNSIKRKKVIKSLFK